MPVLPPGYPEAALRQALRLGTDPYGFLEDGRRRFGDAFTLRLPGDPLRVVFADPELVREVLTLAPDEFRSDEQSLHLNLGERSVLLTDGDRHRRRRQVLTPPLHGARLRSYAHAMQRLTDRRIDGLQPGETFVAHRVMRELTLEVILECVFGVATGSARAREIEGAIAAWLEPTLSSRMFVMAMLLTAVRLRRMLDAATERSRKGDRRRLRPWRRLADAKAKLCDLLLRDVRACRQHGTAGREDVLALLVDARDEDGAPMDDEDVLDQLVTMVVGGHETTANTLCWALAHLMAAPDALARARAELHEAFGDGPVDATRVGELRWLAACIDESMRLCPIAPAISRVLARPRRFGKYELDAGTIVWAAVVLVQRHEDLWPRPSVFDPERFLDTSTPRPEHYLPFGGGRRRCVGAAFAQFEMRIILAQILSRLDLRAVDRSVPRAVMQGITAVPSGGVPLHVVARRDHRVPTMRAS